jgi:hypothetical protein
MIKRNEYNGDLALGHRIKTTAVSSLDTVTEASQTLADTVTTVRSAVELIHGSLQPAIMEQRIELASVANRGIKELVSNGMSQEQACDYLQVPYEAPRSTIAQAAKA